MCTAAGDRVPGPRSYALLAPVEFPWKSAVDHIEEVGSQESFSLSVELCRQGLICGPSSGLNLTGLFQFLEKEKTAGLLSQLAGPDGEIHCVFLCCDLPYQYINDYFEKLGHGYFPSINNEVCSLSDGLLCSLTSWDTGLTFIKELLDVDLYRYDEKWEKLPTDALIQHFEGQKSMLRETPSIYPRFSVDGSGETEGSIHPRSETVVLDLREPTDFIQNRLPGSVNIPLVERITPSPFSDPMILKSLWKRLEETFKAPRTEIQALINQKRVLLVCYDGDSSRVATSVLRAKGCEADSVRGGFKALHRIKRDATAVPGECRL